MCGSHTFAVSSTSIWNSLLLTVRDLELTLLALHTYLKAKLFRQDYLCIRASVLNEWSHLYHLPLWNTVIKPKCIFSSGWSPFIIWCWQSCKDESNYFTSPWVRTCYIQAQVITLIFAASRCMLYMAYIAHIISRAWCGWGRCAYAIPVCILFVSSIIAHQVSFSNRVPVQSLTTTSQRRT